jgi:hypothetical protein
MFIINKIIIKYFVLYIKYMNIYLQIIIGFFLADIIGGFLHWIEDRYIHYCTNIPFIKNIAEDNELHHYFPRSIIAITYIENIKNSTIIAFIGIIIIFIINKSFVIKYIYLFISLFFFSSIMNIIHRFSHMRDCENNYLIKYLQKIGLIITHEYHVEHHEKANLKYCVLTIYTNFILDSLHFWGGLEYILSIFGIKSKPYATYNSYHSIHDYRHINNKFECPDKPTKKDVEELKKKIKRV